MAIENLVATTREKVALSRLSPLFIGTGFPPFYRVIDPIARGRYALSIILLGQYQSAFAANLLSIKEGSK